MKKHLFTLLIGTTVLFSACSNFKNASTAGGKEMSKITDKKWQLVELGGKPVAATINGKVPFIELQDAEKSFSASAGCNGLGGSFKLENNGRIKFSQGISTMMYCDNMEIETEFKKVLEQADNYTINGNTLSLNKARMSPLARFEVKPENTSTELNGTWELDYISGARIAFEGLFPNEKPKITFSLPETKATGNGSCNNFNVAFSIDGNNIKFSEPASTRMACPGNGEASFFETLKKVTKYSVSGNTLNMIMDDIAIMRFQKK